MAPASVGWAKARSEPAIGPAHRVRPLAGPMAGSSGTGGAPYPRGRRRWARADKSALCPPYQSPPSASRQMGRQLLRLAWKNLLRYPTPTLPIANMRHVVAPIDDRPRHFGGGCTLIKETPQLAAVASPNVPFAAVSRYSNQASLFDHLAGPCEQHRQHGEARGRWMLP